MKQMTRLAILGAIIATLSACAAFAATPAESGRMEIALTDYDILPQVIRLKAGQEVTFVLRNEGDKLHELMIGRDVIIEGDFTEGFTEDFFAGIRPEIEGPGMVMGMEGGEMAGMEGMAGMDDHAAEEGEADDHAMAEENMAEMDEHTAQEGEPDEHGMAEESMAEMVEEEAMEHEMAETAEEGEHSEDEMDIIEEHADTEGAEHAAEEDEPDEHGMAEEGMTQADHTEEVSESEEVMTGDMAAHDSAEDETAGNHKEAINQEMAEMAEEEMDHATEGDDDHAMAEGDMAGMEHDDGGMEGMDHDMVGTNFGALQRPLMDVHAGLMVMLDPAPSPGETVTTITFTVPEDKVGEWEMGCFQEQGQHYDDGMRGTLIVEPAS